MTPLPSFRRDQLNALDKESLITLILSMQEQMLSMREQMAMSTAVEESPLRRFRIPQFRVVYLRP